jgi:hypothetical protein
MRRDSNPVITSLSPASKAFGGLTFTLTLNGSGFTKFSRVNWTGGPRNATFASGTQLTAIMGFLDIVSMGTATVTVASGSGFVSAFVVNWNGSPRGTTFVSATQLTAAIPASDLDHSGTTTAEITRYAV